ncbi:MAG: hypothetical protein ABI977_26630 [Acidobacteriota bacterium]
MLRTAGAVVVGYVAMILFIFVTFSLVYLVLGTNGAFKPGRYEVTSLWLAISFGVGLIAAMAGGFVCVAIAQNAKAPLALAGLVLILGLVMAVPILKSSGSSAPQLRAASVGNWEAMQNAKQPPWFAVTNPFIGALGVILGARLKK